MIAGRFSVSKIGSNEGKAFIREHHYSGGSHNGPTCYGMHDTNGGLVGVCAFATPCSENVRASVFGVEHKARVTELHRLVLLDEVPKNGESFLIARALRSLKAARPHLWGVISFADQTEGHVGTVYQATNALYCGTSSRATFYLDPWGRLRHPRQNGVNISRQAAREMGWTPVKREGKHRYLFLLPDGKAHRRLLEANLLLAPLPYPKQSVTQHEQAS